MRRFVPFSLSAGPRWAAAGLTAVLLVASIAPANASAGETLTMTGFADVRTVVLNTMGAATKRIWVTTDYLTDGEIVSAMYVAQYRKLDVQVLLGRTKANFYMSRLNYLKNQNIPVYLRPPSFKTAHSTEVLCDDRLLHVDGDLDFMAKVRKYTVMEGDKGEAEAFATAFAGAAEAKVPAVARPLPLVGRPGAHANDAGRAYAPSPHEGDAGRAYAPPPTPHYDDADKNDSYIYDRKPQPRPEGVPAKLPKDLKWERERKVEPPTPDPETPPPALPNTDTSVDKDTTAKDGG